MGFFDGLGSSIVGGVLGVAGAREQNSSAAGLSKKQMEWQKMMSDTAHQREVADLKKAGLNPRLSAMGGSGASTPSGSVAPVVDEIGAGERGATSALNLSRTKAEIRNIEEQNNNLKAQSATQLADAQLKRSQTAGVQLENIGRAVDASTATKYGALGSKNVPYSARALEFFDRAIWQHLPQKLKNGSILKGIYQK